MRKLVIVIFCCLSAFFATANDGVFYASGNQLIPITETDISVKKEVLTLNRVGDHIEVTVYYEFFNPVGEKELLVGFEAESPYNSGRDPIALFPDHPHMRNFKVVVNGQPLHYEIAHVTRGSYDENNKYTIPPYYTNGQFKDWSKKQCGDSLKSWDYMAYPFDYVYHFKAKFRPGLNIVQHTYEYDLSFSVGEEFHFPYVLTAANRWANHQIDDFTLNINMGDRESFMIHPDFFKSVSEWAIDGRGKISSDSVWVWDNNDDIRVSCPLFHIQEGGVSFRKTNFHPEGELTIEKRRIWNFVDWNADGKNNLVAGKSSKEGVASQYYPYPQILSILDNEMTAAFTNDSTKLNLAYDTLVTPEQRRILRNLPFAYRGYIFKSKPLQDYFESTDWYLPNPEYDGNTAVFSEEERKWVEFWK